MSATISEGCKVTLDFVFRDEAGETLDSSKLSGPLDYVQGGEEMPPGFETELLGHSSGEKLEFRLTPEDGYGAHEPELVIEVPIDAFDEEVEEGDLVSLVSDDEDEDELDFLVLAVEDGMVALDGNHPFAGLTLDIEVEISSVDAPV